MRLLVPGKAYALAIAVWAMTVLGSPRAEAIQLTLDSPSVSALTAATADEDAVAVGDPLTITIGVQPEGAEVGPISIAAYQISLDWDETELSLVDATQRFSDLVFQFDDFTQDPLQNAANGSAVASYVGFTELATDALFSVTFLVLARVDDGLVDFSFAAVGDGLSPGSKVPSNPGGAGLALVPEPGTALLVSLGLAILARRRR